MLLRAILIIVAAITTVSCDPGVGAYFALAPTGPPSSIDVDARDALAIAAALAERHGLAPTTSVGAQELAAYSTRVDSYRRGRASEVLSLWVARSRDGTVRVTVTEDITTRWSPKGDSLRQELRDTLRVHFSSRFVEN